MLDEEPCEIYTISSGRLVQRSRPIIVLGCHVRAVLDEEACKIQIIVDRRLMQWSRPSVVLGDDDVGGVVDE